MGVAAVAQAGDRCDAQVRGVVGVEEVAACRSERPERTAEHGLADVAVLRVAHRLDRVVVGVLGAVEGLLRAVVDGRHPWRRELHADDVGGLLPDQRCRAARGEAGLVTARRHVVVVDDGHDEAAQLAELAEARPEVVEGEELGRVVQALHEGGHDVGIGDDAEHGIEVAAQEVDVARGDAGVGDLARDEEVLLADRLGVLVDRRAEAMRRLRRDVLHGVRPEAVAVAQGDPVLVDPRQRHERRRGAPGPSP